MDPLALLRDFCKEKKFDTVVQNGSRIDFGDLYSFESSTLTKFRSRGGYYSLGTIYFFLKNKSTPYSQYFQNAKKENWETVAMVDKKALTDYMEGTIDGCPQIDTNMPNLPIGAGAKRSVTDADDGAEGSEKRKLQKVESVHVDEAQVSREGRTRGPEEWSVDEIYAQEREKFSSVDGMRSNVDFTFVLDFVKGLMSEKTPREKRPDDIAKQPRTFLRPIIIVPHGMTAILSMYNVKNFLEHGRYVFPEQVYKTNPTRETRTLIARSFQRERPVRYLVSEKIPDKADKATWKRVVAVIVSGKVHQFKDYPFEGCDKGDVCDLLHNRVQGFYFQYHDDNFHESEAANWKVKVLTVHRYHRHGDNLLMQQFWRQLDHFVEEKKLDRVFKY